jgi:hypothetical protein
VSLHSRQISRVPVPDLQNALDTSARLAAIAVAVSGAEMLAIRTTFAEGGVLAATTVGIARGGTGPVRMAATTLNLGLLVQVAAAVCVAALGITGPAGGAALTVCLAALTAVRWRRLLGGDGAEQMSSIVLIAAWLAVLAGPDPVRLRVAVTFIAAQAALSYVTAGVAKLRSATWRSGRALPMILATEVHGQAWAAELLTRHRLLALASGWLVMAFECLFPIGMLLGPPVVLVILAVGLVFHAACAVVMGLNTFVWAFLATYPCVLVVAAAWWA